MPWSFIIPAAVSLFGASKQASAAESAAGTTAAASDRAAELQYRMFQQQQAAQEPYRQAGVNALGKLQTAAEYTPFGMSQFQADPGYAFRLGEGQKALERSAAARGGLISGGALKAATRYGQEAGSQEYTNAFNRYQTERTARLQPLQSLAGVGQTSANTLGQAAGQYGANVGNLYTQQGANQGNALLAGAQARTSAYGDIAKLYGQTNPQFGGMFGGGVTPSGVAAGGSFRPSMG
jgi:hypothetical protein